MRTEALVWDTSVEGRKKQYRQKTDTIHTYMFYLAFENSQHTDYATEKFYHALEAGAVPVVIGAPNIQDFAPSPNSFLYLERFEDVSKVAPQMKFLMGNQSAYEVSNDTTAP
jgi:glycoprotein 3-alpha-L-fucosyltransferase